MPSLQDPLVLRTYDYKNIVLKNSSFKKQFDEVLKYILNLPNDDILYGFRKRAFGDTPPGRELGGWYTNDSSCYTILSIYEWDEIFNTFGQWLSFLGRAYVITGDNRVFEKAEYLLTEWGSTIEKDGYFFYSRQCNAEHYSYEKIFGGLVDLYLSANMEKARVYAEIITDWVEKNLSRARIPAAVNRERFTGGNPDIKSIDNEWYTLPENLYRMYIATGDNRYKEFAQIWHYDAYWDAMRNKDPNYLTRVHGYSHVNSLGSAAMAYRIHGNRNFLETIINAYEVLKQYQLMASGGYAFNEHMADTYGSNYKDVEFIAKSFEVPCGSWAIFKLVKHLITLTGEARYGAWAETALYNAMLGALPIKDDEIRRGKTFYYADYRIGGGRKVYYEHSYPCCSGTYPQAIAEYHNLIYYHNDDCLYISQYIQSKLDTIINGKNVSLEIAGDYPYSGDISVIINTSGRVKIALRIPSWTKEDDVVLHINGEKINTVARPDEWLYIDREWQNSDLLTICFKMKLWTYPITQYHQERAALMYGPIMLAAKGRYTKIKGDILNPSSIAKTDGTLTFIAKDILGMDVEFKPYFLFKEKEWYTVYCDFEV